MFIEESDLFFTFNLSRGEFFSTVKDSQEGLHSSSNFSPTKRPKNLKQESTSKATKQKIKARMKARKATKFGRQQGQFQYFPRESFQELLQSKRKYFSNYLLKMQLLPYTKAPKVSQKRVGKHSKLKAPSGRFSEAREEATLSSQLYCHMADCLDRILSFTPWLAW